MRKFYIFNTDFDCYVEAFHVYIEDNYLIFENEDEEYTAVFSPDKWDYFKEVSIENV